jgi:hypothetical protein
MVAEQVARAQALGLIDEREDPRQLAFDTNAYLLMANADFVLHNDDYAVERGRRALRERLDRARTKPKVADSIRS